MGRFGGSKNGGMGRLVRSKSIWWQRFAKAFCLDYAIYRLQRIQQNDPPTFACVGESDGIADYRIMKARLDAMKKLRIDTEFHSYKGLHHGFGLGENTVADGWINSAVKFWESR